jgi:hypothetical protein
MFVKNIFYDIWGLFVTSASFWKDQMSEGHAWA